MDPLVIISRLFKNTIHEDTNPSPGSLLWLALKYVVNLTLNVSLTAYLLCFCTADSAANGPKQPHTPEKKIKDKEQGDKAAAEVKEVEASAEGPSVEVKEDEDSKEGVDVKPSKEKLNSVDAVGVQKPPGDKYSPKVCFKGLHSSGALPHSCCNHSTNYC